MVEDPGISYNVYGNVTLMTRENGHETTYAMEVPLRIRRDNGETLAESTVTIPLTEDEYTRIIIKKDSRDPNQSSFLKGISLEGILELKL